MWVLDLSSVRSLGVEVLGFSLSHMLEKVFLQRDNHQKIKLAGAYSKDFINLHYTTAPMTVSLSFTILGDT